MLANNFNTSTCFAIFELIKFMCLGLNIQLPAQRISHPAPAPHTKQYVFPHPLRKCGYPRPARVNPPCARPLVLRSLQLPHVFYTSMYLEVIAVLHYNNYDGDIHSCILKACISSKYSKCINAIKRIPYTTAMYSIYPRRLSCISVVLFTVMHV